MQTTLIAREAPARTSSIHCIAFKKHVVTIEPVARHLLGAENRALSTRRSCATAVAACSPSTCAKTSGATTRREPAAESST